uniref:Uncharacterized protein n=1 Tax=Brassica oleracea var. oleracea TaxID=109376 RepID=A0A0D3E4W8_BRAOL
MNRERSTLHILHTIITFVLLAGLIGSALLFTSFIRSADDALFLCSTASAKSRSVAAAADYSATPIQLQAIVNYATSTITPQQNIHEISISFNVLKELAPINFLVFGKNGGDLLGSGFG